MLQITETTQTMGTASFMEKVNFIEKTGAHMIPVQGSCRVAIIGGGFAGASVARSLAMKPGIDEGDIVVFEPRASLGAGLAYDTDNPTFRLNVAAHRMQALPDDPDAFVRYLERSGALARDKDALRGSAIYARRSDFAAFMEAQLQPLVEDGRIVHVRETVGLVSRRHDRWLIQGENGTAVLADTLVIATGHPQAKPPGTLSIGLEGHAHFIADPTQNPKLHAIGPDDDVLIVGAGLTALDLVASLEREGHKGTITLFSRSGLLPQQQASSYAEPYGDFLSQPCGTARCLLRRVRRYLEEAERAEMPWQCVFDALRKQGQQIWTTLPQKERRRFLRHLRRRFEVHRFRMPPQIADVISRLQEEGRLQMRAGHLCRVEQYAGDIFIDMIVKPDGIVERKRFDWVLAATGPDAGSLFRRRGLLADMREAGYLMSDSHKLGIACDIHGQAIASDGTARPDLMIAGPLARGTFGEITGVPEIARQAAAIADQLAHMGLAEPLHS